MVCCKLVGDKHQVYWREIDVHSLKLLAPQSLLHLKDKKAIKRYENSYRIKPRLSRSIKKLLSHLDFVSAREGQGLIKAQAPQIEFAGAEALRIIEHENEVNQLKIINRDDKPAFLPAGTIFRGGRQDRMLAEAIVAFKGEKVVDVYCVEQGRWHGNDSFSKQTFLPALIQHHADSHALNLSLAEKPNQVYDQQQYVWDLIAESLQLTSGLNQTLNANAWQIYYHRDENSEFEMSEDARGFYYIDNELNFSTMSLYPLAEHLQGALEDLRRDLYWRRLLLGASGMPTSNQELKMIQFFRIFDEDKQVAIQCLPGGEPLRDLNGQYRLFYYQQEQVNPIDELQSYQPQNETISFNKEQNFSNIDEFTATLAESQVLLKETNSPLLNFFIWHPEYSTVGQGALLEGQPFYLQLSGFRPYAHND